MKCKNTYKTFPTNQVFSTVHPGLSDDIMRRVKLNPTINRCSSEELLGRYAIKSKFGPTVSFRDHQKDVYSYNLPVGYADIPDFITNPQCERFEKKSNRLTLNQCDLIVREELAKKRHAIKCLFDDYSNNSSAGVSRKSLLKILRTLCPLMDIDMFHRLLERYGLDEEALITFGKFEESFTAPPLGRRLPPVIFHGLGSNRCVSVAQAYKMLREIACDKRFDLKTVLPPSCFEPGGRVLCPQLREALSLLRINLTDENYRRLWRDKFDLGHFGSIKTSDLCKILNLKEDGTPLDMKVDAVPLTTSSMKGIPKLDRNPQLWVPTARPEFTLQPPESKTEEKCVILGKRLLKKGETEQPVEETPAVESQRSIAKEPEFGTADRLRRGLDRVEQHHPRFENVMDCLRYKFEKPYQAMLVAFKHFDPCGLNRVKENVCMAIFREFGLNVDPEGLNQFLRYILSSYEATGYGVGADKPPKEFDPSDEYVNVKPGSVPYRRLLKMYYDKSMRSRGGHTIRELEMQGRADEAIKNSLLSNANEIEEEFVKLLNKHFIIFGKELRSNEARPSVISEDKLRDIINQTVGFSMNDDQWKKLQTNLVYVEDGMVNWDNFLNLFARPTNVSKYLTTEIFDAAISHCPPLPEAGRGEVRDRAMLLRLVEHIVRTRLHHIDKSFKHYDQPELNMLSKEDLGELLNSQGAQLSLAELDFLWGLLDAIEPNQKYHNYRQVMNFFYNKTRGLVAELLRLKRYSTIGDNNLETLKKWREDLKHTKAKNAENLLKAAQIASSLPPRDARVPTAGSLDGIFSKIAPCAERHWDALQRALIYKDKSGATKLLWSDFKQILRQFGFPISETELDQLCAGFASKDRDYVVYPKFLNELSKSLPKENVPQTTFDERTYQFTNQKTGDKLSTSQVLAEIRKACTSQCRTLQEAFKKFDKARQGYLSINQIDKLLRKRGIELSRDDLYHLLSTFDIAMNGVVEFHEFKRAILKAYKPLA